ncbi:MAG: hypothetical protein Q9187_007920 [Circinaria calcarea]
MAFAAPAEAEWLSSTKVTQRDDESEPGSPMENQPPQHPVPTMQGAFEESIMETMAEMAEPELDNRYSKADSISRRKMLLEQEKYERTVAGRWKQKPGEKFHPLWKLVAQISFGMHLLSQALAKSDEEVIKILQNHVDEVDGFLERTTEDFDLAQNDINERIRYLNLPLEHGQVFDTMLNDRAFRIAIVQGNEKIEHIVDRTATAMKDALKDVQKGLDATRELAKYLTRLERTWTDQSEEHESVYLAMIGNTEGWTRAFLTLQQKGNKLGAALVRLESIIAEIQKRAGFASRKNLVPARSVEGKYFVEPQTVSFTSTTVTPPLQSPRKPLPRAPSDTLPQPQLHDDSSTRLNKGTVQQPKHESVHIPKSNSTRKLKKKSSKDIEMLNTSLQGRAELPGNTVARDKPLNLAEQANPSQPSKQPSRRVSISERTRSLTRKLSFFKDYEELDSLSPLPIQGRGPEGTTSRTAGKSSPKLNAEHLGSSGRQVRRSSSPSGNLEFIDQMKRSIDSHTTAEATASVSAETKFSQLQYPESASSVPSRRKSIGSPVGGGSIPVPSEITNRSPNDNHPLLRDIRPKEVRFMSNAAGSPLKPTLRDLPLRNYRSTEVLSRESSRQKDHGPSAAKRTSSLHVGQSPSFMPKSGSSVYSSEAKSPTPYPPREQPSSNYSPNGLPSSLFSNSPAPVALSPPPAQSSAAPSPLRLRLRNSFSGPKSAPLELTHLPLPALSPTNSPGTTPPPVVRHRSLLPSMTPHPDSNTNSETTINASTTQHQASFAKAPSSHNHTSSISSDLMDFLRSTPAASYDTPSTSIPPESPPSTQGSARTSATNTSAPFRAHYFHSQPFSIPTPRTPNGLPTAPHPLVSQDGTTVDRTSGKSSPWRKVFGGGGGSFVGGGKGHRKTISEKVIIVPKGKELRKKTHRPGSVGTGGGGASGEAGFTGMGKDGVWITKSNFLSK